MMGSEGGEEPVAPMGKKPMKPLFKDAGKKAKRPARKMGRAGCR